MEMKPVWERIAPGSVTGVHQFVGGFAPDPGFGRHVALTQQAFREAGLASEIFAREGTVDLPGLTGEVRKLEEYRDWAQGSVMLLHALPGCHSQVVSYVFQRSEPLVVWHYGTPDSRRLRPWDAEMADAVTTFAPKLRLLAGRAAFGIGTCELAESELVAAGFLGTVVAPGMVDPIVQAETPVGSASPHLQGTRWIVIADAEPGQGLVEAVAALAAYRTVYAVPAGLVIAGTRTCEPFARALRGFAANLGVEESVTFRERGKGYPELAAELDGADVLMALGGHLGTGAAVVAALARRIPVVAAEGGPVEKMLAGAGLCVRSTEPLAVAASVRRLASDITVRRAIDRAAEKRSDGLSQEAMHRLLWRAMEQVTGRLLAVA